MCLVDKYGADAIRLYLINSPVVRAEPLKFVESGVQGEIKVCPVRWVRPCRTSSFLGTTPTDSSSRTSSTGSTRTASPSPPARTLPSTAPTSWISGFSYVLVSCASLCRLPSRTSSASPARRWRATDSTPSFPSSSHSSTSSRTSTFV